MALLAVVALFLIVWLVSVILQHAILIVFLISVVYVGKKLVDKYL